MRFVVPLSFTQPRLLRSAQRRRADAISDTLKSGTHTLISNDELGIHTARLAPPQLCITTYPRWSVKLLRHLWLGDRHFQKALTISFRDIIPPSPLFWFCVPLRAFSSSSLWWPLVYFLFRPGHTHTHTHARTSHSHLVSIVVPRASPCIFSDLKAFFYHSLPRPCA